MPTGTAVFLDTSIQIARFVHSPANKKRIEDRLKQYDLAVTGTVVRQEFKRRLLKEARYLLEQLERRKSFEAVQRHVIDVLPPPQARKKQICLQTLQTIFEMTDDSDRTKRAELFLRSLLKTGLSEFDQIVDHVITAADCACARQGVRETKSGKFDFGSEHCSEIGDSCGIAAFLGAFKNECEKIRGHLAANENGKESDEIRATEEFLDEIADNPTEVEQRDPCLTVGDLLIAIESCKIGVMYTMNGRESQHLCRAIGQTLIVRKPNPDHEDIVCPSELPEWPKF